MAGTEYDYVTGTSRTRHKRRGRRLGTVLLVLLLVLVALLVVADRVAAYAASRTIADQAQQQLVAQHVHSPDKPTVSVDGFPFLTQVAAGRYQKVVIHSTHLTSTDLPGVVLDRLDVTATGINASTSALLNGNGSITADHIDGTATLGWNSVTKLMVDSANTSDLQGVSVSSVSDGEVQLRAPVDLLGTSTTVVATGQLVVSGTSVKVKITKIDTEGGNVPPGMRDLLASLRSAFAVTVRIPPLPYHLKVSAVHPTPVGIAVTAFADNVPLSSAAAHQ
ncbi:MAG: DUF2993 domain-containing protein [Micromonosporaceae bacterium]|nr:DUF2993 domain-containing protein [Micromonosporaceae bacterium]